jgi:hypothetical protein
LPFGAIFLIVALPFAYLPASSTAGTLSAFEADANARTGHAASRGDHDHDFLGEALGRLLADLTEITLVSGGACSLERINAAAPFDADFPPRQWGEPLIPFVRADLGYQWVAADTGATDVRAEAGYGPLAAHYNFTRYREGAPDDRLDLVRVLGLYRMSLGSQVEVDLGLGSLTLRGDSTNSRFLCSLPVLVHPGGHWGIEFRPAWAERVSDYDLALLLTWRAASFKAGYRWVNSPHESLAGPYAGLSLRL